MQSLQVAITPRRLGGRQGFARRLAGKDQGERQTAFDLYVRHALFPGRSVVFRRRAFHHDRPLFYDYDHACAHAHGFCFLRGIKWKYYSVQYPSRLDNLGDFVYYCTRFDGGLL